MAISSGKCNITLEDILNRVSEEDIAFFYLNIKELPCVICSPLREDKNPSFGLYSNGNRVGYVDFSTKEKGSIFDLLGNIWHYNFADTIQRIYYDMIVSKGLVNKYGHRATSISKYKSSNTELRCKVREWQNYDIEYWESYGISLPWLKYANVYPISHIIIVKGEAKYTVKADKFAYAYVEKKEGKVTLKIYQPFSTKYKWTNKHDRSVLSLWTKIPKNGLMCCICSSLKDALCLWSNTGIPSIAVQGEGYSMSETAIQELKNRFDEVFILFDNDKAGLEDSKTLSESTGFTNIIIPQEWGEKDISDYYKAIKNKDIFKQNLIQLFKDGKDSHKK